MENMCLNSLSPEMIEEILNSKEYMSFNRRLFNFNEMINQFNEIIDPRAKIPTIISEHLKDTQMIIDNSRAFTNFSHIEFKRLEKLN